jgi:hypothetical protein
MADYTFQCAFKDRYTTEKDRYTTEVSYHQQHTISSHKKVITREEIFTTVDVENAVFWDMTPSSLVYYKT